MLVQQPLSKTPPHHLLKLKICIPTSVAPVLGTHTRQRETILCPRACGSHYSSVYIYKTKIFRGLVHGSVGRSCCTNMRTCVQIPSTHILNKKGRKKCQAAHIYNPFNWRRGRDKIPGSVYTTCWPASIAKTMRIHQAGQRDPASK